MSTRFASVLFLIVTTTLKATNPLNLPEIPKDASVPTAQNVCGDLDEDLSIQFCFDQPLEEDRVYRSAQNMEIRGWVYSRNELHSLYIAGKNQKLVAEKTERGFLRFRFNQTIKFEKGQENVVRILAWDVENHVSSFQALFYPKTEGSHLLLFGPEPGGDVRSNKDVASQLQQFVAARKAWSPGDELILHFSFRARIDGSNIKFDSGTEDSGISLASLMDILQKDVPILRKIVILNLWAEPAESKRILARINGQSAPFDLIVTFLSTNQPEWAQRQQLTRDSYRQDRLAYGSRQFGGSAIVASNEYPPYRLPVFKTEETEQASYILLEPDVIKSLKIPGARIFVEKRCYGLLETSTSTIYILNKKGAKEWVQDKYKTIKNTQLGKDALSLAEKEAEYLARKEVNKIVDKNTKSKKLAMLKKEVVMVGGKYAIKELLKEGPYVLNTFERDRKEKDQWYHVVSTKEEKRLKIPLTDPSTILPDPAKTKVVLPDMPDLQDENYDRVFRLEPELEAGEG